MTLAVFVTALVLVVARRWRRKTPEEIERERRLDVNRRGRITHGEIINFVEPEPSKPGPRLIVYKYDVTGATYEASQDVSALPEIAAVARRLAGRSTSVKYDPRLTTNSIVVCEEWSGLPDTTHPSEPKLRAPVGRRELVRKG